jgi:hypothetical protein
MRQDCPLWGGHALSGRPRDRWSQEVLAVSFLDAPGPPVEEPDNTDGQRGSQLDATRRTSNLVEGGVGARTPRESPASTGPQPTSVECVVQANEVFAAALREVDWTSLPGWSPRRICDSDGGSATR